MTIAKLAEDCFAQDATATVVLPNGDTVKAANITGAFGGLAGDKGTDCFIRKYIISDFAEWVLIQIASRHLEIIKGE